MELEDLEVYKISRQLSKLIWEVYEEMDGKSRYTMGSQILRSIDSIGANIAEGYGRYHYLDSLRFYYNARGSLWESKHWIEILYERRLIPENTYNRLSKNLDTLGLKLNNFINTIKKKTRKEP